ncbi:MAG: RNA 2'-phosphotransferase [Acetobacteraceae bacterium]
MSRVISHALRHEPWRYELELGEAGWTDIDTLLAALRQEVRAWTNLTEQDLADMIRTASKQRFEVADGRIRALYGHSLPGKLHKVPAAPPACLFHGTSPAAVPHIRQEGLRPMRRQFVHLSPSREDAIAVGRRKSPDPVILSVRAQEAWNANVPFYTGNEKVWLADHVPPEHIDWDGTPL